MCLFVTLLFFGPRAALFLYWLAWPARWEVAFDTFLVPLVGVLVLPWTTLMYVMVAPNGVVGFDFVWLMLAAVADIASYAGDGLFNRSRVRAAA